MVQTPWHRPPSTYFSKNLNAIIIAGPLVTIKAMGNFQKELPGKYISAIYFAGWLKYQTTWMK